jgi:hypothetical protein
MVPAVPRFRLYKTTRRAKMNEKNRKSYEISCLEVLDVLF